MQRVCGSCGQDPGTGIFCQHCGTRLSDRGDTPTQPDESGPAPPLQPAATPPSAVTPPQLPVASQPLPARRKGFRTGCLITVLVLLALVVGGGFVGWRFIETRVLPGIMGTQEVFDQFEELEGMTVVPGPPGPCYDLEVAGGRVTAWTEVSCDGPRDVEAFFWADFREDVFPGDEYLAVAAADTCGEAFAVYVGTTVDQSRYAVDWLVPSESTWANGDRQAVCLVVSGVDSPLTGSVKGSAS